MASKQDHLSKAQKEQLAAALAAALADTKTLFDGKLGHYKKELIHLDIMPNAVPIHSLPYSILEKLKPAFKKELHHLVA